MHKYMRAIGFSKKLSKKEQETLLELVLKNPDKVAVWNKREGVSLTEVEKDVAYNVGICLRGEGIHGEDFVPEYFFPYVKGSSIKAFAELAVERHADKESYAGICDDVIIQFNVIFYVQNAFEYIEENAKPHYERMYPVVKFAGLSVEGKIIFPVSEDIKIENNAYNKVKAKLFDGPRDTQEALEAEAMENYHEYQKISKRVNSEDVYSIVDHAFIPYGVECDNYMIIGDIKNVASAENYITKEKIWILNVHCRTFFIDVCINQKDLLGEPAVGRRFKGEIWLQGDITLE